MEAMNARRSQRVSSARAQLCAFDQKRKHTELRSFRQTARTWINFADELEQTDAFLAAIENDEQPNKLAKRESPGVASLR